MPKTINISLIIAVISFLYWIYLIDPFRRRPLRRNYIKLNKDQKYLWINVCLSVLLMITNKPMTCLPLLFILIALGANKTSLYFFKRNFFFILRGDLVRGTFFDYFFSVCLMTIPMVISIIILISFQRTAF